MRKKNQHTTKSHLYRIEGKVNAILEAVAMINARLNIIERQQREDFKDETLNRMAETAKKLRETSEIELKRVRELYGK